MAQFLMFLRQLRSMRMGTANEGIALWEFQQCRERCVGIRKYLQEEAAACQMCADALREARPGEAQCIQDLIGLYHKVAKGYQELLLG